MRHPRRRPAVPFVPRVEVLEDRQLLAPCIVSVSANGTVFVRGTNGPDHIQITDNGTSAVNNVTLVCNKQTILPGVNVNRLVINTRGGNDGVTYALTGPLLPSVARTIQVDLGSGNNVFSAKLNAGLMTGANLAFTVNAGTGNDHLSLLAGNYIPIAAGASLSAALSGGRGVNVIQTNYNGQLFGLLSLFLKGNAGPDFIRSDITLTQGSAGSTSIQELGGFGDDTFVLDQRKISLLDRAALTGSIDGGPGRNVAFVTPEVSLIRVQKRTLL
jgi:hypothetical protein